MRELMFCEIPRVCGGIKMNKNAIKYEDLGLTSKVTVPASNNGQIMEVQIKVKEDTLAQKLNPIA